MTRNFIAPLKSRFDRIFAFNVMAQSGKEVLYNLMPLTDGGIEARTAPKLWMIFEDLINQEHPAPEQRVLIESVSFYNETRKFARLYVTNNAVDLKAVDQTLIKNRSAIVSLNVVDQNDTNQCTQHQQYLISR